MHIVFLFLEKGFSPSEGDLESKLYDFFQYAKERYSFTISIASLRNFDEKSGVFSHAFAWSNSGWKKIENVKPDIIYDQTSYFLPSDSFMKKRRVISTQFPFFNYLDFSRILTNKWETYLLFKEFHPKTVLIENKDDLEKITDIPSSRVVVKPLGGFGGEGVFVSKKQDVQIQSFPLIVQEFIETKAGIPNIAIGRHDLRVIVRNDTPFYSIVRSPQNGSYLSNVKLGGSISVIPLNKIPSSVFPILSATQKAFSHFKKKLYSIDFLFNSEGRPYIVEGNARPGIILAPEEIPYREYYYDNFIKFLIQV